MIYYSDKNVQKNYYSSSSSSSLLLLLLLLLEIVLIFSILLVKHIITKKLYSYMVAIVNTSSINK